MKIDVSSLLNWYYQNFRFLPWRIDKNPYHVWISEIMLQQTRIETVINYYNRFIKTLPTIQDLASCDDEKLFKLWEGLGYYSRVKNLKRAAIQIVEENNGVFPTRFDAILLLPGIGEYTASAIGSICFSLPEVTIDGNVLRVFSRVNNDFRNIDDLNVKKEIRLELKKIVPKEAGDFNQALMELGETVCLPKGIPKCDICPLSKQCQARIKETFLELPVKLKKKSLAIEKYTILIFKFENQVAIRKRTEVGLLSQLWEFPNLPSIYSIKQVEDYLEKNKISFFELRAGTDYTHIFTHKKWEMCSYIITLKEKVNDNTYHWLTISKIKENYAIPTAFKRFLEKL